MHAEQQLKASLKELGDLKAALDEHAIVAITDPQGNVVANMAGVASTPPYPRFSSPNWTPILPANLDVAS